MLLAKNQRGAPKVLSFFDQLDKSPDSGLPADDSLSKYIGCAFPFVFQTKGKKDHLIASYYVPDNMDEYSLS